VEGKIYFTNQHFLSYSLSTPSGEGSGDVAGSLKKIN